MSCPSKPSSRNVWRSPFGPSLWLLALLGSASAAPAHAGAAAPASPALVDIQALRTLPKSEVASSPSLRIRGVVTYYDPKWDTLFVQDQTAGVFVFPTPRIRPRYQPGQVLEVTGRPVTGAVANSIIEEAITVVGTSDLPRPITGGLAKLAQREFDSQFIELEGVVRTIASEGQRTELELVSEGHRLVAHMPRPEGQPFPAGLLHARVRVHGVCGAMFDQQDHFTGIRLFVPGPEAFVVLVPPAANAFSDLPVASMTEARGQTQLHSGNRVRVSGLVTLQWPSGRIFLQEGSQGLEIELVRPRKLLDPRGVTVPNPEPVALGVGDRVEAVGYPAARRSGVILEEAEVRRLGHEDLPPPAPISGDDSAAGQPLASFVQMDALLMEVLPPDRSRPGLHRWLVRSKRTFVECHLEWEGPLDPAVEPESLLRVAGIWTKDVDAQQKPATFQILMRSPADITVLHGPPGWLTREAWRVLGVALGAGVIALGYIILLRRQVRLQADRIGALNREAELQTRYRELYEALPDVFYRCDLEGKIQLASPSVRHLLGFAPEELVGRPARDLYGDPEQRARVFQELMSCGAVNDQEVTLRHRNGRLVVFSANAHVVRDAAGRVIGTEGFMRDISARKQAEESARRAEAVTRTINAFATSLLERDTEEDILWDLAKNCVSQLGFVDCAIYVLDKEAKVLLQKAAFGPQCPDGRHLPSPKQIALGEGVVGTVAVTGQAELVRDTDSDPRYVAGGSRCGSELAVPIVAHGEVIGIIDSEHPDKDFYTADHLAIIQSIASLCANKLVRARAEQALRALNAVLEDRVAQRTAELQLANRELQAEIEERIRAEETLREREQQQRAIFDNQSDLAWMKDHNGCYIAANQALARERGLSVSELPGKTDWDLFPPDVAEQFRANDVLVMEARETRRFEETYPGRDGRLVPMETIKSPIFNDAGKVTGTVGVARDITERKRAEAELRNALAKEKELNQLKSNFVSLVSHEFRTPLEIIMSSAEILGRYLERLSPPQRQEHLQAIHKSVKRMVALMEEVLLLGRVEADKVEFRPEELDLAAFCRRITEEILTATGAQNPIRLAIAESCAAVAQGDENLLRHIFTNLLSNAIKYSRPGEPVDFEVRQKGTEAIFRVVDQGCGIPAEDQERLFQAFYRAKNATHIQGTGLGLVIVKRCVALHRGAIRCESAEGSGTTFVVTLPLFPPS